MSSGRGAEPGAEGSRRGRILRRVRQVWVTLGITATVLLVLSYQARGFDRKVLASGEGLEVRRTDRFIAFEPDSAAAAGLVFFPGGMVDPTAYSPLARRLAEQGFTVAIVRLPMLGRHASSTSDRNEAIARAQGYMTERPAVRRWVIAGHSLGGGLAAEFAFRHPAETGALVLIGTSHPKDLDLSTAKFRVTKVYGSRDGVASPERIRATARFLPANTEWIDITGGNHAQFGYYGPQLGDHRATIPRTDQQNQLSAILVTELRRR